ncbi:MAG: hypothetical protein KatS3mg097_286 [Candidatus Parcubacteria bacterium]|nr:MAG: hypothetical protein KatS3mg097_286 [Candidatus Parcubacteria bacterium]
MFSDSLQFNLKQIIFFALIIIDLLLFYFIFYSNFYVTIKLFIFFSLLIFLITIITVLELVNSLLENILLWLTFSVFVAYIFPLGGVLLFLLSLLKVNYNHNYFLSSVQLPFIKIAHNNFIFIFHAIVLMIFLYVYINFDFSNKLPFDFVEFKEGMRNVYVFFVQYLNFNQPPKEIRLVNFDLLLSSLLNNEEALQRIYAFMNDNLTKNNNILYLFLTSIIVLHGFFYVLGFILSLLSYLIFFLMLKFNILKIVDQPVAKQFLQF